MQADDSSPQAKAVRLLNGQQRAMLWILLAIRRTTRQAMQSAAKPDFAWLRRLAIYLERYPERIHMPNEEETMFSRVAPGGPAAARMVARLRRDHQAMERCGFRLRTALADWQQGDRSGARLVAALATDYARLCLRHVRAERRELLPAAQRFLSQSDWLSAGTAFEASADQLAAARSDSERMSALQRLR